MPVIATASAISLATRLLSPLINDLYTESKRYGINIFTENQIQTNIKKLQSK